LAIAKDHIPLISLPSHRRSEIFGALPPRSGLPAQNPDLCKSPREQFCNRLAGALSAAVTPDRRLAFEATKKANPRHHDGTAGSDHLQRRASSQTRKGRC